mgnify:CR=1 FL=1
MGGGTPIKAGKKVGAICYVIRRILTDLTYFNGFLAKIRPEKRVVHGSPSRKLCVSSEYVEKIVFFVAIRPENHAFCRNPSKQQVCH